MKDIGEGTIRRIDWTELTPVVLLLRVFNVSLGLRVLALALLGLGLTVLLSFLLNVPVQERIWITHQIIDREYELVQFVDTPVKTVLTTFGLGALKCQMLDVLVKAFFDLLDPCFSLSFEESPQLFLWLPSVLLIWAFCGGMTCRIVALRLTVDESESTGNLLLFFRKRGIGFISSILILLSGILCCFLPIAIAAWLLAIPGLNYAVAILLPIPLVFAVFWAILALGMFFGWMLLFAAVSTDGSDGFDAISRMFSYIYQRPLHYIFYWFCSGILGWLGFLFLIFMTDFLVGSVCENIARGNINPLVDVIVSFWSNVISLLPTAYAFSWFWTSSVAIYLLLRRSVDATPFIEVYRVEPPKVRTLPTIKPDERGAPEIKPTEPEA